MLEEILDFRNIEKALKRVISNKGAAGVDGMQTDELRDYLHTAWLPLKSDILEGRYTPCPVRKVEIPKAGGGKRMLGIPTVLDRLIQQAIAQWLSPRYEPEFSLYSYGFRIDRNAHQAVTQAKQYLNEGKVWVIEIDIEKFFDRVNHDKLTWLLSEKIKEKRTLKLIRSYLASGIMEGGITSARTEGTPQGSPLSPLLSNIMLHELDKELGRRGHSFVRYADDCSIYVKSEKSAHRVQESIITYLERELKLPVNREKTQVSRPNQSTLLGFSFYRFKREWEIRISPRSIERIKDKLKAMTIRKGSLPVKEKIKQLETVITGWVNYYRIARARSIMQQLDEVVYVRLRMGIWKQWKKIRTRGRNLMKLGRNEYQAWAWANSSLGYCRIAHSPILQTTLSKKYFLRLGYVGFYNNYYWKTEHQIKLF